MRAVICHGWKVAMEKSEAIIPNPTNNDRGLANSYKLGSITPPSTTPPLGLHSFSPKLEVVIGE